jgi:putative endonuclease
VGCTTDLNIRLHDHARGKASETTRRHPPLDLLRLEPYPDFSAARKREAQLKRWSHQKKHALVTGDLSRLKRLSKSQDRKNGNRPPSHML